MVRDPDPSANNHRPVRQIIDALILILLGVEQTEATPEQMQHIANERLPDVWEYLGDRTWCQKYVKALHYTGPRA